MSRLKNLVKWLWSKRIPILPRNWLARILATLILLYGVLFALGVIGNLVS